MPNALRRRSGARDLALIASFTGLISVLGLPGAITVFGNAVPLTLQTLGVMLAGSILGPRRAMASVAVFLVLVALGLPLLAGGRGGLAVFAGPSVGYLLGWVLGAGTIGWLVARRLPQYPLWWGRWPMRSAESGSSTPSASPSRHSSPALRASSPPPWPRRSTSPVM